MIFLYPREAGAFISSLSENVTIKNEGISSLAQLLYPVFKQRVYSLSSWKEHTLNPKSMDEKAVNFVFVCDTLNFSFWSDNTDNKYSVTYKGVQYTGYWSLCAAMNRAIDEGIDILNPHFYSVVSKEQLKHIFRSDNCSEMPLVDDRLLCLYQVGQVLINKYNGSFLNVVKKAEKSAEKLLKLILQEFGCFCDEVEYKGKRVGIYKRAQILVADIWGALEGTGDAAFSDIDVLTAFADYRIPQALEYFGVLQYSDELKQMLHKDHMFKSGDSMEVEIRGCTIHAIELLLLELKKMDFDLNLNSVLLDHYLWDYRREHADKIDYLPIHKIRCIYY